MFRVVCADFETDLIEFNGEVDHVHLLVSYPPKISLSTLVNSLKGVLSRRLRQERPDLANKYWKGGLWSPSYYVGSVGGAPIDTLRKYIENQIQPKSASSAALRRESSRKGIDRMKMLPFRFAYPPITASSKTTSHPYKVAIFFIYSFNIFLFIFHPLCNNTF